MANVSDHATVGPGFGNTSELVRVVYDFSVDGGATGALNLITADGDLIIKNFHAVVKTACTSGGSATLDVGIAGGDTDALMDAVAVAGLTLDSLHSYPLVEGTPNTKNVPLYLADAASIAMTIGVAAFTAGKIEFVFEIVKA